ILKRKFRHCRSVPGRKPGKARPNEHAPVSAAASAALMRPLRRGTIGLWICAGVLLVAMIGSLAIGPVPIEPGRVLTILSDAAFSARPLAGDAFREAIIVLDIRLPRMVLGVLVGASLGVTGALLQ